MDRTIPAPFTKGFNFSGWLEHRSADDVAAEMFTKKDFEHVREMGGDVVRIPIHFERFIDRENGCAINGKILAILDNVAAWSKELGIYVIFDFHNNTHVDSVTPADVEDVLTPVWTQLAERYKDASEYLVFELMNEPHGIDIDVWNGIIGRLFKKVREIDKIHYIIVGGADWNSTEAMRRLPDFKDDKVIYTFHFYDPHTFTHQGAPWCHMERVKGLPFPYDKEKMPPMPEDATEIERRCFEGYPFTGTIEAIERVFDVYSEFSMSRNAPVFCGEFGCNNFAVDKEQRAKWYSIVTRLLDERGIPRTSWDYYGGFGIFEMKFEKKDGRFRFLPPKFPEDLNREVLEAMGFKVPGLDYSKGGLL